MQKLNDHTKSDYIKVEEPAANRVYLIVRWKALALLLIAAGVILVSYWPVKAAMMLSFFRAESTAASVVLNWGTASEINVEGYKIHCKEQDEPYSAYHVIGTRIAKGGPGIPAAYEFMVTQDMHYGEQYCFRLEEVTTDGIPGEQHDICGYGPGVTPTPAINGTLVAFAGSLTPVVVTPPAGFQPPPTLVTPVTLVPSGSASPTPIGLSPLATPVPGVTATSTPMGATPVSTQISSPLGVPPPTVTNDPFGFNTTATAIAQLALAATPSPTATGAQPVSPLSGQTPAPTPTLFGAVDPFANPSSASADTPTATSRLSPADGSGSSPLSQPTSTATETPSPTPSETATLTVTPSPTAVEATATLTQTEVTTDTVDTVAQAPPNSADNGADQPADSHVATAAQMYIVVTATDTPVVPSPAPTMTALPTVTPTPEMGLLNALYPSAQNMMVMMLCLIFMSATALGSLGLVTAVLYYRSQSRRRY